MGRGSIDAVSLDDVIEVVAERVRKAGSLRNLARLWDVSPSYLSDLLLKRRRPGPKILKHLGMAQMPVVYRYEVKR